jgi:hypothetical protein
MREKIVWEDPPEPKQRGRKPGPRWQAMKDHPGKWMLWSDKVANRSGNRGDFQKKGYETAVRSNGDGTFRLYVRWPEGNES